MAKFKKGQSGNPSGRPKIPDEIKEAQRLTQSRFAELTNKYLHMSKDEMTLAASDPNATILELMIAKIFQQAIMKGDQIRLSFILDRLIGKPTDKIESTNVNLNQDMSEDELIRKVKEKLAELEKNAPGRYN